MSLRSIVKHIAGLDKNFTDGLEQIDTHLDTLLSIADKNDLLKKGLNSLPDAAKKDLVDSMAYMISKVNDQGTRRQIMSDYAQSIAPYFEKAGMGREQFQKHIISFAEDVGARVDEIKNTDALRKIKTEPAPYNNPGPLNAEKRGGDITPTPKKPEAEPIEGSKSTPENNNGNNNGGGNGNNNGGNNHPQPPHDEPSAVDGLTVDELKMVSNPNILNHELDPAIALRSFPAKKDMEKWWIYRNHVLGPKIEAQIHDFGATMETAVTHRNKRDFGEFFGNLGNLMRDPSKKQLVKDLSETGRIPNAPLESYKDIAQAIKNGDKVTREEFDALARFFDKRLDGSGASQAMSQTGSNGGASNMLMQSVENAGKYLKDFLPDSGKKPSHVIMSEWEANRFEGVPLMSHIANTVLDHKVKSAAGLGVASLVTAFTMANTHMYDGPLGQVTTFIADMAYREVPEVIAVIGDVEGKDVIGRDYSLMVSNKLTHGSTFDDLTKKITGIDLFKNDKTTGELVNQELHFSNIKDAETYRTIIQKTGDAKAGNGMFTQVNLTAYKLALSRFVGEGNQALTTDTREIMDRWANKVLLQMRNDPNFAQDVMRQYFGQDPHLENPANLKKFLQNPASGESSLEYRPVLARYAVSQGWLDNEKTIEDGKVLSTYISNRVEADLAANSASIDAQIAETLHGNPPPVNEAAQDMLNEVFDDPDFSDLSEKRKEIENAFRESGVDATSFEKKLDEMGIPHGRSHKVTELVFGN